MTSQSPCHCTVLRRSSRIVTGLYDDALKPAGLTVTQFALLRAIKRLRNPSITDTAHALDLDRTTLGRNIAPLREQGLVELVAGKHDKRARCLKLTRAGLRAISNAEPRWLQVQERVEKELGQKRIAELRLLLADVERLTAIVHAS